MGVSLIKMVNFCAVPSCSNRSDRDTTVSYHRLPVNKPLLLKQWIHKIGRQNLPILDSTRVCSEHSKGRKLRPDEFPTLNLPSLPTQVSLPPPVDSSFVMICQRKERDLAQRMKLEQRICLCAVMQKQTLNSHGLK